jgi:hypothetical protein
MSTRTHDGIVVIQRQHAQWAVESCRDPLFVCGEMFLDLEQIERRRWHVWELRKLLAERQSAVATLADFLQAQDIAWLETTGARIAHTWYLDRGGVDQTILNGISLGRCIEYDVKAHAIRLLKLWRSVERLMQRYPACTVLTDYPEGSIEWRVLKAFGREVQSFGSTAHSLDEQVAALPGPTPWRARTLARSRRWGLTAMRLLASVCAIGRSPETPVAVVRLGLQTSLMLDRWLAQRRDDVRFSLWMDYLMRPRTVLPLILSGATLTPVRPAGSASQPNELGLAMGWPHRRITTPEVASDLCVPQALVPMFDEMVLQIAQARFPKVATDIDHAHAALAPHNTALLVIPNDCQPLMRSWTLVAKKLGKRTLVVQHGHLDYTEDEDHLTADYSAFWSEAIAQDYISAGLHPRQALVTGSPNADDYAGRRERSRYKGARAGVLIITTGNPGVQAYIHETWVCDYIAGVLAALSVRLDQITLTVKLHPGEDGSLYKAKLASLLPAGTEVKDGGNLVQMISEADVVISPPSTVVIEARAAGTPVILLSTMSVDGRPTSLRHARGVVAVDRYEELPAALDQVLSGHHLRSDAWPIDRYLGPVDGLASQRLLEATCALASSQEPSGEGCQNVLA